MNLKPQYMNQSLLDQAEQFRQAYNLTTSGSARGTQKSLIDEEWSEFHEAYHHEPDENQLKELADLVYVCFQYAASQDWDLDEAMRRVHKSNMSKLGEDGKPIYRGDGKVLKGPNYAPPQLGDLINA
jgi:predicted HAD superfamily Cof-like phosphohydrolase